MMKKKYNSSEDEVMEHIVNSLERRAEQEALGQMQLIDENEFRAVLSSAEVKYKAGVRTIRWRMLVAISSVAVFVLLWVGFQPKYSTYELYEAYASVPVYEPAPPSRGVNILDQTQILEFNHAVEFYQAGKYAEAAEMFRKVLQGKKFEEVPEEVVFYSAFALIQIDRTEEAIERLNYLAKLNFSEFKQDAQWELALAYLKVGKRREAKKVLDEISNSNEKYNQKVKVLLSKISMKLWF